MCTALTPSREMQAEQRPLPATAVMARVGQLASINDPGVQMGWIERFIDTAIARSFAHGTQDGLLARGWHRAYAEWSPRPLDLLLTLPGRDAVTRGIENLAKGLCHIGAASAVRIRPDTVNGMQCPRFHVDRVKTRLLCTDQGVSTHWIHDRLVERSKLGTGSQGLSDQNSSPLLIPDWVKSLPQFAVAVPTGRRWPGNQARSAVHHPPSASPTQPPRVLVAIDLPSTKPWAPCKHQTKTTDCQ